ncbi:murein biosynthesis integral membrane protein MurJ [Deltaproteobacteria bacterium TL4]
MKQKPEALNNNPSDPQQLLEITADSEKGKSTFEKEDPPASNVSASDKRQLFKHAGIITGFTLISRILGAARDLVISHIFGAGLMTDAFVQAFTIPNVLRRLTAEGSMTLAFIPIYTEIRQKRGRDKAKIFAQKTLGLVLSVTLLLTLLGMVFSPQLVFLFSAGFVTDPEKFELTVTMTRLMFPYLIFVSLVALAMGVLNSEKYFASPAAAPIFLNLSIICAALLIAPFLEKPIIAVTYGVLAGGLIQVLLQIPSLRKLGQALRPLNFRKDPDIHRLLRLMGPSIFGVAVYQINIIILRNLASFLPTGQLTYYYNASRLTELVQGVFAFALATASFPDLSHHSAKEDWQKTRETLTLTFSATMFILLPATVGLITAAYPVVSMMYLHGAFTYVDVEQTALTLQAFALSIPAVAGIRLLVSVFYALKDTKTPVVISCLSVLVTGVLGWWWSRSYQVIGLAFGLSVGTWFQLVLFFVFLLRQQEFTGGWIPLASMSKQLIAAIVMGIFGWNCSMRGNWEAGISLRSNWGLLFIVLTGSALIYFLVLLAFKETHALSWWQWFRKRISRF